MLNHQSETHKRSTSPTLEAANRLDQEHNPNRDFNSHEPIT
jgi:hypothetical protein